MNQRNIIEDNIKFKDINYNIEIYNFEKYTETLKNIIIKCESFINDVKLYDHLYNCHIDMFD